MLSRSCLLHIGDSLSDVIKDKEDTVAKDESTGDEQMIKIPVPNST